MVRLGSLSSGSFDPLFSGSFDPLFSGFYSPLVKTTGSFSEPCDP